jgi:FkbM family methyltransferase
MYALESYSQEGEDLVLRRYVGNIKKGYYVDIGCHHPERFSNTYLYYKNGWSGMNIDADPNLVKAFNEKRERDKNLSYGVGNKEGALDFYIFNEKALNTFDKKLAEERNNKDEYYVEAVKKIKIKKLKDIFKQHLPKNQSIDFMSVDVEGRDFDVLSSNDWQKYRPRFIVTESYNSDSLIGIEKDRIVKYLINKKYMPVAKTYYSIIFKDEKSA